MSELPTTIFENLPSYGTILGLAFLLGFAAANAKALPLVYTFRLLPSAYRLFAPRFSTRVNSVANRSPPPHAAPPPTAALPALFEHYVTTSRAIALDLDINVHKSNSTFFSDADIGRAALLTTLLGPALARLGPANFILAGVQCRFGREIKPYQAYAVSSRILAWDEKSLYLVTYFLRSGTNLPVDIEVIGGPAALLKDEKLRRNVFATMITKYVFKAGRRSIPPGHVFQNAGLLVSAGEKSLYGRGDDLLAIQKVEEAVKQGLGYVQGCMA
jgi:acyl-CoA thioesterase FadM